MKSMLIAAMTGLLLTLAPVLPVGAEQDATVLVIRPEKLGLGQDQTSPALARDPFSWSAPQIARFKAADRKNREQLFAGLALSGIIWDRAKPLAIINGKMLEAGGEINGAKVKKISKESVLLQKRGINYRLEFEPAVIGLPPGK